MGCPYLKQVVMLYCDAFEVKKMVPLDRLVSANPCVSREFTACPLFRDAANGCQADAPCAVPAPDRREVRS